MRIKSVAAVGALGVGLGIASFIGAGAASASCTSDPIPVSERVGCLVNADLATFAGSVDPAANIDTFLNGTDDPDTGENDGLGIKDQPQTFVNSLKDFAAGPVAP